jgi:glycerol 2-dehydrogenase (NADP+)
VPLLRDLLALETGVIPAVNQIELHPYCQKVQQDTVDECLKHHIVLTACSPLGSGGAALLQEPLIEEIAKNYNVTPTNILISLQANKPHHTGQSFPKSPTNAKSQP